MKRLVIDLDDTLTIHESAESYIDKSPNRAMVEHIKMYKNEGFEVIIQTARNMRTYENSIGKINAYTLPTIIEWLKLHDIPFDEIHVGKPWCGKEGFYVDDRAVRPSEFLSKTKKEIYELLKAERNK